MIADLILDAGGGEDAVILNTDDLMKLFGSKRNAININWIKITPLTYGSAVVYELFADYPVKVDESEGDATQFVAAEVGFHMFSLLLGATGGFTQIARPAFKSFFRFATNDVAPQINAYSLFPILNNLVLHWDANVDCNMEIDFTVLPNVFWDMREEIMDLLANKTQVEDPNISNVLGKRAVRRAPLRIVED